MPVSRDGNRRPSRSCASYDAAMVTDPAGVNFSALLSRFSTICLTFWRSLVRAGTSRAQPRRSPSASTA